MKAITGERIREAALWRAQQAVDWLRGKLSYARQARALQHKLFQDVESLTPDELALIRSKFHESCLARGYDSATEKMWETHIHRILLTEKWIAKALSLLPADSLALDLGAESVASDYLRFKFPQARWENTDFDVRYPWKTPPASVDLIICTELVEHLSDQPNDSFNEGFYKQGFIALTVESFKALKPGGYMFLSTPNAASVVHLWAAARGTPPWFFIKHVREYILAEVTGQLQYAGFEVVEARDVHCMTMWADHTPIFRMLLENGFPVEGRGDDLFVLVRKP
jgi:hypothetical protein